MKSTPAPTFIESIFNRRILICVFIGFASGLPFYILLNLVPAWLKDEGIGLKEIGFFALGVHLMHEQEDGVRVFPPPLTPAVGVALTLRLIAAPGLMLAMSALIVTVPDAFLVQAAMASGINGLAVAHVFGLDLRLAASAIAWSTAIVLAAASVAALVT